jgi:hypothetical protein
LICEQKEAHCSACLLRFFFSFSEPDYPPKPMTWINFTVADDSVSPWRVFQILGSPLMPDRPSLCLQLFLLCVSSPAHH